MSECCNGDSGLGAVGIPTDTPSGGEGFVRSIRWVDLRIGPGGNGTELNPYNTVAVGLAAIQTGGTLMVVGGDASAASSIDIGSKSATVRGLGGQDDDGGRTVELPPLTYAITTGAQELTFHNVSVVITHTGADAGLSEFHFFDCPSVSLLADGDAPAVHWQGNDACLFSGEGGPATLIGGTIGGYEANSGAVTIRAAHITGSVTSSSAVTILGGCTFGAGVTITAPSISIDIASHGAAVAAGVSFSSTPALQAVFAAPVNIGTANAAGSANSLARSDHVHDLPFTPVQEALAAATGAVSVNSQKITNLATPTNPGDAVNKAYADAIAVGLKLKDPAVAVAAANQATLSGTAQTVDGVALDTIGMRVLLTAQTTPVDNGLWVVESGAWTRPTDFDTGAGAALSYVPVTGGSIYAGSGWLNTDTAGSDVIDTDDLTWGLFTQPSNVVAGTGLTNTGNTINVIAHADGSIVANADDVQVGVLATDAQHGVRGGGTQHAVATTSVAGFMSAADKTKLDGVVFGSPVDVGTANADGAATTYPRSDHVHRLTFATVAAVLAVATAAISVNGEKIIDLDTPTDPADAATKAYVDAAGYITAGAGLTKTGATIDVVAADATITVSANDIAVGVIQTANIAANAITDARLRDSAGFSVIGKATTGSGDPADIVAGTDTVFGRNGSGNLGFAQLATGQIANDAVTYAKIQNVSATGRIMGRITAGAGDMEELTGAQATSILAAPGSTTQVLYNNAGAFDAASGITVVGSETAFAFGATPAGAGLLRFGNNVAVAQGKTSGGDDAFLLFWASNNRLIAGDDTHTAGVDIKASSSGTVRQQFGGTTVLSGSRSGLAISQMQETSGTAPLALSIVPSNHTGLTASSEVIDVSINGQRVVTRAAGGVSSQRGVRILPAEFAFSGPSTIDIAATLAVAFAPVAGTNATITNRLGLWFEQTNGAIGWGSTPARSGLIRAPNNFNIAVARNAANTDDVVALAVDSSNVVVLGGAGTPNAVRVYANATTNFTVAINGTDEYIFSGTIANFTNNTIQWGTNPADGSTGFLRGPHSSTLWQGRNQTNSSNATLATWGVTAANALTFGDTSQVAAMNLQVNGGGTFTLDTGGTAQYTFSSTLASFTDNSLTFGTTPASSGRLRFPFAASLTVLAAVRNGANSADVNIISCGGGLGNDIDIGDHVGGNGSILNLYGNSSVRIKPSNTTTYDFSDGIADFGDNHLEFFGGRVSFYEGASLMGWIKNGGVNNGIEYDTDTTSESHNFLVNSVRMVAITSTQVALFSTTLNMNGTSAIDDATHVGFEAVAAPASPGSAGEWRIYADAGTGRLRAKNNAGTVRDLALP